MAVYYVTAAGAGSKDGSTWGNALGEAEFEASLEGAAAAGDIYYIMQGTYTLDSAYDSSARDGTAAAPISLVGVKSGTTAEPPTIADLSDANLSGGTDDRPLFACGANAVTFGDYYKLMCLSFTTTSAAGIALGAYAFGYNCKAINSSGANDRLAWSTGADSAFVHSEGGGLPGTGVVCRAFSMASRGKILFCYAHDCRTGLYASSTSFYLAAFCVFEDISVNAVGCAVGIVPVLLNNTFNDCAVAVSAGASVVLAINNILEGCTTAGFSNSTQADMSFFLNNHGNDARNTDMWVNVATAFPHGDLNNTTGDPLFDADGNLSLQSGSPCRDAGVSAYLGT